MWTDYVDADDKSPNNKGANVVNVIKLNVKANNAN